MPTPSRPGDPQAMVPAARLRDDGVVRSRCRSFCFVERDGVRWTVFLITYLRKDGQWRGYFAFRNAEAGPDQEEIRTADLFVEESEPDVDGRARGLGRPLVLALLESSLVTHERRRGYSPDLQGWFREMLGRHAAARAPAGSTIRAAVPADVTPTLTQLRSLYDSYRLDQVAHLIALMDPRDFRDLVEARLDGRRIDFQARDRFQLAMIVVQDIERRLPLPPFEVWVEDYLNRPDEYVRYTHLLHREGLLP